MTSLPLENLCKTGALKAEPASQREIDGLLRSAKARLGDARNQSLSIESRFDLAYNASHAFALAALRRQGYRSDNRYLVFQCLPHTLGIKPEIWRILAQCHHRRNLAEYEGNLEIDDRFLTDLIAATALLQEKLAEECN